MKDMKLMVSCAAAVVIGAIVALAPAAAYAQNLVDNGDFESGTLNWFGGEIVTDSPHGGLACLRVVDDDPASSVAAGTAAIVPVTLGTVYRFQVWVRATDPGQRLLVTINQYDAGGSWISGHNYDFDVTVGTDWSSVEYIIRVFDELTAGIRISLRPALWTDSGDLMGTAWFDDVVFEESPIDETPAGAWLVHGGGGAADVWHSSLEQKVRRDAALPDDAPSEAAVAIFGARGEAEPFEVVLVPRAAVSLTGAALSSLIGPSGSSINASLIEVREVAYVEVTDPTDQASMSGWLPDPLPPLEPPLALAAGVQQPLWVTVPIPAGAEAGDYTGMMTISFSSGEPALIPVTLHVWDFNVPPQHHLRTAYGMGTGMIDRYHNLGGDGALRDQVISMYLEDFSSHRISPYNPFGDDMYSVSLTVNWPSELVLVDPDSASNHALRVEDASTTTCVGASAEMFVPVTPGTSYTLSWRARTEAPAQDYMVAVSQYDAAEGWISGQNLDFTRTGDGTWRAESVSIDGASLDAGAAFVRLTLYARPWTADGAGTGVTWFDDVVLRREVVAENFVMNGDFEITPDESVVAASFGEFDAAARRAFDTLNFDGFVLPLYHFAYGSWEGSHTDVDILGYPWGSPEYEALFTRMLQAVTGHMSDMGWLGRAYTYWYDEPSPPDYALVQQGMDLIARAEPNLKRMLTEQVEPELVGYVDIWSPVLSEYDEAAAHERQAAGEDVWWYMCTGPRAPYPNNFIDHPGIEHRILFWMAWKYGVQGSLYWETTWWTNDNVFTPPGYQDPWVDPRSIYYTGSGDTGNWGNGDGRLLYPPRDRADGTPKIEGPTPSIRWELLREGIEDFEYFSLLGELADGLEASGLCPELLAPARALLEVPESIIVTRTQFTQDPALLAARRGEVAEMIEDILGCTGPMEEESEYEPVGEGYIPSEERVEVSDGEGDGADQGGSGCGCQVAR